MSRDSAGQCNFENLQADFESADDLAFPYLVQEIAEQLDLGMWGPLIFRPIHYLGSKLRALRSILTEIDKLDPQRGRVADLFAGSGAVSAALSMQRDVTAVDVQEYSRVLCSSLLGLSWFSAEAANQFEHKVRNSPLLEKLLHCLEPLITLEQRCIRDALCGRAEGICDVIQSGSIFLRESNAAKQSSDDLQFALDETFNRLAREGLTGSHRTTVSRYFGGIYFSYLQSVQLDAALDCVDDERRKSKDAFLAAILSTASTVVNTIGKQFAQPIMPIDGSGAPKRHLIRQIEEDRSQPVIDTLGKWLRRYASLPRHSGEHSVIRGDYPIIERQKNIAIVYADPPYTRDHYSRYYHVLETMCRRDNPELSKVPGPSGAVSRGMYRVDRHQSPFCIKTQAAGAFEKLFALVRNLNVPLLLSYSPYPSDREARPRLMTVMDLTELSRKYFRHVDLISVGGIVHNKLNTTSLNFAAPEQAEILLSCRP